MVDAAGKPAQPPAVDSFWAGPQRLGDEELAALQMKTATVEDHLKVAEHFQAEAEALDQQAETHDAMAKQYRRPNLPPKVASLNRGMSRHCANLSRALRQAAQEARQLSENHKAMANAAGR
jgi:hypothetical protein